MPESFDGLRLSCCCFAILIDTGSKVFSQVVQQSGHVEGLARVRSVADPYVTRRPG